LLSLDNRGGEVYFSTFPVQPEFKNGKVHIMFRKFLAIALLSVGAAVCVRAAEIVSIDLNYYSEEPISVKPEGKLPNGVTMLKPIKFRDPKLKGLAFRIRVDIAEVQSVDLKFTVKGSGRICPSLSGYTTNAKGKAAGKFVYKCTALEFCDEPSAVKLPFVVKKWKNMLPKGIDVSDGETVTVKATFEKAD